MTGVATRKQQGRVAGGLGDPGGAERAAGALRSLEVGRGEPLLSCEQRRGLDMVFAVTLVFPTPSNRDLQEGKDPTGPAPVGPAGDGPAALPVTGLTCRLLGLVCSEPVSGPASCRGMATLCLSF